MNPFAFCSLALALAGAPVLVSQTDRTEQTYFSATDRFSLFNPSVRPDLPPVYFCGESVPLHEDRIARRLVSALTSNAAQSSTFYKIRQRAAVFFPVIEPILAYHHIPADFKYLPLVESALRGVAVSPKGATGYWQFMPGTARELGLSIRPGHDERRDLTKSTHAACRYLNFLHNQLGSWTLAAAAYNSGMGALLATIRRQQQRDYYYLRLNAETGKYLYRILAFKELFSNYRHYRNLLPDRMMASLSEPLLPESAQVRDDVLLPEILVADATRRAVDSPVQESETGNNGQPDDIPLPNAAEVFRGGIKARLTASAGTERGQVWLFRLTHNGPGSGAAVEEGDILYAVVEDFDQTTNRLYLRADRVYAAADKRTYPLALTAVDASTGRIGIHLTDMDRIRAGWLMTWKVL